MTAPLARSAPEGGQPQLYADHVAGVVARARQNAEALCEHMQDAERREHFRAAVMDGAAFHDLGKLDPKNQSALHVGRSKRMACDHVDAGVAHLLRHQADTAAWIVRAHHRPGLPNKMEEFSDLNGQRLRGGRLRGDKAAALSAHIDRTLPDLLSLHEAIAGPHTLTPGEAAHGLFLRLALSCLVDADHTDSAFHDHRRTLPEPPPPRWEERLTRLDAYVASLRQGGARQADRDAFYYACRHGSLDPAMVACEGPVGIGKTTAILAWLLRRAIATKARRLFVVAPFTTILSQIAEVLRLALLLDDERARADEVIAEHHHRAEFDHPASRDLAVLWRTPIIVTTGVQFFETLAACEPARLRKLHALPGSVIFLDEAHATLPRDLWRQNWAWMRELAADWGCSFVLASGSLARGWEQADLVGPKATPLPDLVAPELSARLARAEHDRLRYATLGRPKSLETEILNKPGPRLAVFNTVQTAAVMAKRLRDQGTDVLHLSTALCPDDRTAILAEVKRRLHPDSQYPPDWTLVATSLVEAGIDLSFRTGFRESFSTASLIQLGGRINRHGLDGPCIVYDFLISEDGFVTIHPGAKESAAVLKGLFKKKALDGPVNAAELVTRALREEIEDAHGKTGKPLAKAESQRNYPEVAKLGLLINADTKLVVVKPDLAEKLEAKLPVSARELLGGSVTLWSNKVKELALKPLSGHAELYRWSYPYDQAFLGYMAGALPLKTGEAFIV